MQAIGIDIGTTSICGVVIDTDTGKVLHSRTENSNAFIHGKDFERIQSPEKIISIAANILDGFISDATVAIGVTGQMHGIVYTDTEGLAVSPLYTWQDGRGDLPFKGTTYAEYLGSCTGYGNVTDFYNRENSIVPNGNAGYCTIHDYFVMRLCGLKKAVMHTSNAASLGCFDLNLNKFTYDCDIDVTDDYTLAGKYRGIPVGVAIGDNQASVFSCLASEEDILLNVGTGSQVSVISDKPISGENIETRPYFENKYLIVGAALCGGRAYAVLKNFYKELLSFVGETEEKQVYEIMGKMLSENGASTLTVDTRFSGTRADKTITGSITGITEQNFTPRELTAGVLNGMVNELYSMYRQMSVKRSSIVGSGNGIRKNAALIKAAEKKFGAVLKIPAHPEEAAYGAALFSLICSGHFKNAAQAQRLIVFN